MLHSTERELVKLLIEGQENAFTLLYKRYRPFMLKIAINKFISKQEAEDVIQEIFLSLWQRRNLFTESLPIKNYLIRAIHLQYAHRYRHKVVVRKYEEFITQLITIRTPTTNIENKEITTFIKSAIEKITAPSCRRIFELAYLEEQNCHEIAASLEITPQVVRNQTCRALKIIREHLRQVV